MTCVDKNELMCEIMAVDFAITDIKLYNSLVKKRLTMIDSYQSMFGPIIAETYDKSEDYWRWIDNPWPWDKEV